MRLSPLIATALPFLLLAAMLASIVAAPRLHSNSATDNGPVAQYAVQDLPAVIVNASADHANDAVAAELVRNLKNTSVASCAWMTSGLRMPYFSFATPRLSTNGI